MDIIVIVDLRGNADLNFRVILKNVKSTCCTVSSGCIINYLVEAISNIRKLIMFLLFIVQT